MYVPSKFVIDEDAAWEVVRDAGAGMLVLVTPAGLESVFVPVVVSEDRRTMTTHVARVNPWWRSVSNDAEVLALFVSASAYVSPSLYPSRDQSPGVVPTWNYVAAQVRGRVRLRDDAAWVLEQVRLQTARFEEHRNVPWRVEDSPSHYIDQQLRAIVGLEIDVVSIEGKAKLSQNRPVIDHDSVRRDFTRGNWRERSVAERMRDIE